MDEQTMLKIMEELHELHQEFILERKTVSWDRIMELHNKNKPKEEYLN